MIGLARLIDTASLVTVVRLADGTRRLEQHVAGSATGEMLVFAGIDHDDTLLVAEGPMPIEGCRVGWSMTGRPYCQFKSGDPAAGRCLVAVHQPLKAFGVEGGRSWVDTVVTALEAGAPEGLLTATFLVSIAGDAALNLAVWISADAHRSALRPSDIAVHGSLGAGDDWRRAREHPAITVDHEVRRYASLRSIG